MKKLVLSALFLSSHICLAEATPSETLEVHIRGEVSYRCYAGYDGKKVFDEMTKEPCDNKDYKAGLLDKNVTIKLTDEPDPENSPELAGSWMEQFDFKGRKFKVALSLSKTGKNKPYLISITANDNEPSPRETNTSTEFKSLKALSPITVKMHSVGKKEEISFSVTVGPYQKK